MTAKAWTDIWWMVSPASSRDWHVFLAYSVTASLCLAKACRVSCSCSTWQEKAKGSATQWSYTSWLLRSSRSAVSPHSRFCRALSVAIGPDLVGVFTERAPKSAHDPSLAKTPEVPISKCLDHKQPEASRIQYPYSSL